MRRVALISDQHFDTTSRWAETLRIAAWIVEDLRGRKVDAIALGGDLFERRPNPQETKAVAEWVAELADIAPVIGVYGNHDVPDSLAELPLLEAKHPIAIFDRPAVHMAGGVAFACLPWPRKAHLLAQLGDVSQEGAAQAAVGALQNVFRGLADEIECRDCPKVFLGHVSIRGSRVSTGQPMVGTDMEIGLDDLALVRAQAYLLGHIHMGQALDVAGAPAIYPGSIRRTQFGELEDKAYAIVSVGKTVQVERVVTPATPMLLLTGTYSADHGLDVVGMENAVTLLQGAELRLRVDVPPDQREAARAAMTVVRDRLLAAGALNVKIEEQIAIETRSRAPEVARATTLVEKLDAFWHAKSFDPGGRRAGLVSKVQVVEDEVRNAG